MASILSPVAFSSPTRLLLAANKIVAAVCSWRPEVERCEDRSNNKRANSKPQQANQATCVSASKTSKYQNCSEPPNQNNMSCHQPDIVALGGNANLSPGAQQRHSSTTADTWARLQLTKQATRMFVYGRTISNRHSEISAPFVGNKHCCM